jgi:predicted CoA-binding protein
VTDADVLANVSSVLLIDYPGTVVPETVARAGYQTTAHEGPGEDEYYSYAVGGDGEVVRKHIGRPPARVDLVYTYRPVDELPAIVAFAVELGARACWFQDDGSQADARILAGEIVKAAGLAFATGVLIDVL